MFETWEIELHGHPMVYRTAGAGPPVVLIHGMVNSSRHWERVAARLAPDFQVIAPDLIGHGDTAGPRGDYSLGAHAARIRDLLAILGIDHATMVGHSYGGGVAMQYFWQFPQRVDRLVLVSSGGLGPEVSPLLRSAALPGMAALLAMFANRPLVEGLYSTGKPQLQAISRALRPLSGPGARQAFLETLRSVIDMRGQRVAANDKLYLLDSVPTPTLIVWGERDNTIPLEHGRAAHEVVSNSRFETLPGAAHFPHIEDPEALARVLRDFLETTPPSRIEDFHWGDAVGARAPRQKRAGNVTL